ncbi:aspartate--tRNA ligase [Candidatus Saccharibacteria bacterium RIFCSPHIGHO2_01_FULL_45_15]|nr:MAG: aspartate--tRNA ligase [Candidatus Saccharibacteria bacterium RIFCSPHIGHO2_01_FULL_45_15]OGL28669.1 MAG: aspartate--tRNA ligase [Candidatus Saccharibacteria bacterium RIFCSPHIGHO2_02_FULL_46_12]OGL31471.1 MAG: aspartate--tRNA ligase [Candidatus Saccharibacteria bacterium RIFCSPHIGHO2_12_FULL_44_22]
MTRILATATIEHIDETISVSGWVNSRRDHGGLIFIDVRDHTGVVQIVVNPEAHDAFSLAETIRDEYVLAITGVVTERDENLKNPNLATGTIEIVAETITILNKSDPLPVAVSDDGQQSNEELRLKYRYLDLRRPSMQQTLKRRSDYYKILRQYMDEQSFTEVTTPILANSSPEGARDFLVPSRVHPGKFYALPQAPQQFKQLLMVGGLDRYYQIATCFRDEDPRADRLYGDFYQLDLEMSFVDDGEVIRSTMEPLIKRLVTEFGGKQLVSSDTPRIPYQEAMDRFGSDKPDLRFAMELTDLSEELADTEFGVFKNTLASGGVVKAIRVEGGASLSRSQIDKFTDIAKREGAGGLAYISYENGESKSPIAKFLSASELDVIKTKMHASDGDTVFFGTDKRETVNKVLGKLRSEFADHFGLKDPNKVALAWIVDFPFYEWDEGAKKVDFGHNPFSMPRGGAEVLTAADTDEKKLTIVADQYDMVMNGYEIASGAVRNHNPEVMYEAFGVLGYSREYVEDKFGAMLSAFKFGAPPHAGAAFGIDRIFMVLSDESNIREVVAFPKNGSGVDVMMSSPSTVDAVQLKDLSLQIEE